MEANFLKSTTSVDGFTTSSSPAPWQCSRSPSIHSESSCRSSTGMAPPAGAAEASAFCTQVGISSMSTLTRKLSSRAACFFASSSARPRRRLLPMSSNLLRTYCVSTPLIRTISSSRSPRTLVLICRPRRSSNLEALSRIPFMSGITSETSKSKFDPVFSLIQKIIKQPMVFNAASNSGQISSHSSASMVSGTSSSMNCMWRNTTVNASLSQKSLWCPEKSS
mmetsp:Transcript_44378/g.111554  ORF Transcript_44378/g.111554 Transcript_44378/m.111554 type:complete len:222 (-) Transcript_44378:593-1258(-)